MSLSQSGLKYNRNIESGTEIEEIKKQDQKIRKRNRNSRAVK
jgi:hypothetical protein